MTLYLKYRPQRISELDLESVREHLKKTLAKDDLPHAWLLTGPRGTGKTSTARIIAKMVNCQHKQKGEPCNKCEMCETITAGTAPDVVEIDAASNRGIDEIRDLREKVGLAPLSAKYKVYIIDEVHMLTTEAANALLKTLEEPPDKVVFVLCTTEAEKLPETVVSRCTVVQFKMPSIGEIVDILKRVAATEGMKVKSGDLELVAKAARGSFRDAIKILEQAAAADGDVAGVLGMVAGQAPEEFLALVRLGKRSEALGFVERMVGQGANVRGFIELCVEKVREDLLVAAADGGDTARLISWAGKLQEAYERTKSSAVVQLPLEMWVIEMTQAESPKPQMPHATSVDRTQDGRSGQASAEEKAKPVQAAQANGKYRVADVTDKWAEIMRSVKPKNHSVEALLRSTRPVDFDGNSLTLEVFYKFHLDKLATDKCREIVETSVAEVFGLMGPVRLALRLGEKKAVGGDGASIGVKAKQAEELDGAVEEDIIRAAQEIFKAEVI